MTRTAVIIPARYGSKRIPQKNFKNFLGRPILYRVIDHIVESDCFNSVFVNSDAPQNILMDLPSTAELIRRSPELADDFTPIRDVVQETIQHLEADGRHFDVYALVYATAVLVPANSYSAAHSRALENTDRFLLSVTDYGHPIQRSFSMTEAGALQLASDFAPKQRTQDFTQFYHDAAAFCFGGRDLWLSDNPIIGPDTIAHILPRTACWDIDTQEDWDICEAIFARHSSL